MKKQHQAGFTLAEVLIALALLGVVAAFAIPQVLISRQETETKAKFKEVYGTLSEIYYKASLEGDLNRFAASNPNRESFLPYMQAHLNVLKTCPIGLLSDGCTTVATHLMRNLPGVLLANGVMIGYSGGSQNDFFIDLNADAMPNTFGEDIVQIIGVSTPSGTWCGIPSRAIGAVDPVICPDWGTSPESALANQTRFRELIR